MRATAWPMATPGLRNGLLGGSFNPANDGHRHVSLQALNRLGLDQVWWLVSPQNPLKDNAQTQPLERRLKAAQAVGRHARIKITDIEMRLNTRFSVDTMKRLRARWPGVRFVWLMGADIFPQLPLWRNWTEFMAMVPVAVFDRPGYGPKALSALPALRYALSRWDESDAAGLAGARAPAWMFVHTPMLEESSSALRENDIG